MTVVHDKIFHALMQKHAREVVQYLLDQKKTFSILCNIQRITFDPFLPELKNLPHFSLFVLMGYTFESIELDQNALYFEAGFGKDNAGSLVNVPFDSIIQISLHNTESKSTPQESLLFTNILASFDSQPTSIEDSMRTFLQNPENQHLKRP